jgi:hypothetical protein
LLNVTLGGYDIEELLSPWRRACATEAVNTSETILDNDVTVRPEDKEIAAQIVAGDDLSAIVKSHLYLESFIAEAIEGYVSFPQYLRLERMTFIQKARLAASLGIIEPRFYDPIVKLNALRNRVVHDLHTTLEDAEIQALFDSLPPKTRERIAAESLPAGYDDVLRRRFRFSRVVVVILGRIWARRDIFVELRKTLPPDQYAMMQHMLTGRHLTP